MKKTLTEELQRIHEITYGKQIVNEQFVDNLLNKIGLGKDKGGKKIDDPKKADLVTPDVADFYKSIENAAKSGGLSQKSRGSIDYQKEVESLQIGLMILGYQLPKHGVDGLFGPETAAAVTEFKTKNSILSESSIVGKTRLFNVTPGQKIGRPGQYVLGKRKQDVLSGQIIGRPGQGTHNTPGWQSRNAYDIVLPEDSKVFSISSGTVKVVKGGNTLIKSGVKKIFGDQVTVTSNDGTPNVFYTHLQTNLKDNSRINKGDVIGTIVIPPGGIAPHLHIGLSDGDIKSYTNLSESSIVSSGGGLIGRPGQGTHNANDWQSRNAWDVTAPIGSQVFSISNGTVKKVRKGGNKLIKSGVKKIFGDQVTVTSNDGKPDAFYTHIQTDLTPGTTIKQGDVIGTIIKMGGITPHLHVGLSSGNLSSYTDLKSATGGSSGSSSNSGSQGPMVTASPEMLNKLLEMLKSKGVKSEQLKSFIDSVTTGGSAVFTDLDLTTEQGVNAYSQICQKFIDSKGANPLGITGKMMADAAKQAFERYKKYVPAELALSQLVLEGGIGNKNLNSKPIRTKNPFNVGNVDSGAVVQYGQVQSAINTYYNLIARSYLGKGKTAKDLLGNFVNNSGNRYASAVDYESKLNKLASQVNSISKPIIASLSKPTTSNVSEGLGTQFFNKTQNGSFTTLNLQSQFDVILYSNICQKFINSRGPNPLGVTGKMMADAAKQAFDKYRIFVPAELALGQLAAEGGIGASAANPNSKPIRTKNPFNVGNVDSGAVVQYGQVQSAVNKYYDVIAKDYLSKDKTAKDLIGNFVNKSGKRYASAKNYESTVGSIARKANTVAQSIVASTKKPNTPDSSSPTTA